MNTADDVYARNPIRVESDIPIFSEDDSYVVNYKKIGADHVAAIKSGIENPFMNPALWRESEDSTRQLIRRHSREEDRILDVGVGLGRLLAPLETHRRHGVDISLDYLRFARAAGIDAVFARIEDLPYRSDVFDIVCCSDVLEHVFDLYGCTKEMLRVLRPNGLLVARVPYREPLMSYLADDAPYEFVHLRNFDLESLKLHFSKIFGCQWIEHSLTTHKFFDPDSLAIQLPIANGSISKRLKKSAFGMGNPYKELARIMPAHQADLIAALRNLEKRDPAAYSDIIGDFMIPLEINIVIRKVA